MSMTQQFHGMACRLRQDLTAWKSPKVVQHRNPQVTLSPPPKKISYHSFWTISVMGLRELQYLHPRLNSSPGTPGFCDRIKNKRLEFKRSEQ